MSGCSLDSDKLIEIMNDIEYAQAHTGVPREISDHLENAYEAVDQAYKALRFLETGTLP